MDNEEGIKYSVIIICGIITLFTILLIIIYSIDKNFKSIPCYFNIFFCIIITLDDLLRLIPQSEGVEFGEKITEPNLLCKMQAMALSILDKYILNLVTVYSIINFLSIIFTNFYEKYTKAIFIILIFIGLAISLIFSIIYYLNGIRFRSIICYIDSHQSFKIISDTILTSLLFLINLFCLLCVIINVIILIKKYKLKDNKIRLRTCKKHLIRLSIYLIINFITFILILLLINKLIPSGTDKDLLYVLLCLLIELCFTMNGQLFKAFMRLITCNKIDKFKEINDDNTTQLNETEDDEF